MTPGPRRAMVLAAGLGRRMRPITDTIPKPLVPVAGKPLIDWGLDKLAEAGVETAVVNIHYRGAQLADHLRSRTTPKIAISDESELLLDSGGGIVRALPMLGTAPFFLVNADTFWMDRGRPSLERLSLAWNDASMDILLMLVDPAFSTGHSGGADFVVEADGRLARAAGRAGFIYAGAAILNPRIFAGAPDGPHSLNLHFDAAVAAGRLFGMVMQGRWITVGTPDAIAPAEAAVAAEG